MEKIELGTTGIHVSRLGLGTVKIGRNTGVKYPSTFDLPDDYTVTRLLSTAQECGINLIDTAPAYGTSEERIGNLLPGNREDWVICTKAGEEFENNQSRFDFSPAHFTLSLERSLKRLKTDYIDILLIHSDGEDLKILNDEKLIHTLENFKTKGMVRAIGASTKTVAGGIRTLEKLDIVMAAYNKDYTDEKPILDYAAANNKPVLLKKILNSGHLAPSPLIPLPEGRGKEAQTAFDLAFSHPGASAAIVGTINPERLRANAQMISQSLSSTAASHGPA